MIRMVVVGVIVFLLCFPAFSAQDEDTKEPPGKTSEAGGEEAKEAEEEEEAEYKYVKDKEDEEDEDVYRTVVKGKKDKIEEEVPKQILTTDEILKMPGTGGDLLRAVQNLPGVARPPMGSGLLVIRGAAPADSLVMLEGHRLPLLYHFGTFASVIKAELIDEIEYIPGNFSVRYGRATGGLINVSAKLDIPEKKWSGIIDVDMIDASALTFVKLTDKAMIAGEFRRSIIDLFIEYAIPDDAGLDVVAAPVYYDYQLFASYKPTKRDEISFIVAGDDDRMKFIFKGADEGDPGFIGAFGADLGFHLLQVHYKHRFKKGILYHGSLMLAYTTWGGSLGETVKFDVWNLIFSHFQVVKVPIHERFELKFGVDTLTRNFNANAIAPSAGFGVDTFAGADLAELNMQQWLSDEAFFVETKIIPHKKLTITGGVRMDHYGVIDAYELHPRVLAKIDIDDLTAVTGGVGIYSDRPSILTTTGDWGNPNLKAPRVTHYGVGIERKWAKAFMDTSLQFFWKSMDRVIVPSEKFIQDEDGVWVPEHYNNRGSGRSYGLELMVKFSYKKWIQGWLAYTLSKSERWIDGELAPYPFDYDQPHILTLIMRSELGKGWEIGLRFQFSSGNPYTGVIDSIFYADYDTYIPVYESRPTRRQDPYHQLDLRIDKKFKFKKRGWISLSLEVINLYYAKNPEGIRYNYDYTQSAFVTGMPIFTSIGLQGGW